MKLFLFYSPLLSVCSVFFFLRENQKCAWNCFWAFFWVFSRTKKRFHAHFFASFHVRPELFTGTFFDFFTHGFCVFTGRIEIFFEIFTYRFRFFTDKEWRIPIKGLFTYYVLFWLGVWRGGFPLKLNELFTSLRL